MDEFCFADAARLEVRWQRAPSGFQRFEMVAAGACVRCESEEMEDGVVWGLKADWVRERSLSMRTALWGDAVVKGVQEKRPSCSRPPMRSVGTVCARLACS